ncbi:MAG: hypothetical protein COB66_03400 [Coxiella sp. (in: Bacteria)]|nr:MAG: hypothetical protein COB66_03400 [Coxiella sp. (in: g-proteobacteria)]
MDLGIKQRIVGGVVVACVLAIFLPILLHKPKTVAVKQSPLLIPRPGVVSEMSLQLPNTQQAPSQAAVQQQTTTTVKPVAVAKTPVPSQATTPQVADHTPPARPHHPTVNTKILQAAMSTPQAWIVQLASFSQDRNAKQLITKLRAKGFEAYSRRSTVGQHAITRVFVGPEIRRADINKIEKRLHNDFRLQGVVRKYHV